MHRDPKGAILAVENLEPNWFRASLALLFSLAAIRPFKSRGFCRVRHHGSDYAQRQCLSSTGSGTIA